MASILESDKILTTSLSAFGDDEYISIPKSFICVFVGIKFTFRVKISPYSISMFSSSIVKSLARPAVYVTVIVFLTLL